MLNHKLSRKAQLFLLGALLGVAIFLLVYGTAPLNVANDAFCRGGYIERTSSSTTRAGCFISAAPSAGPWV